MKIFRNIMLMLLCAVPMMAMAQTEPVKWSHSVTEKGNGLYTVEFKAELEDGWHIYATDPKLAFNPTTFEFETSEGVATEGELRSVSKVHIEKDELLMMEIGQYDNEAIDLWGTLISRSCPQGVYHLDKNAGFGNNAGKQGTRPITQIGFLLSMRDGMYFLCWPCPLKTSD